MCYCIFYAGFLLPGCACNQPAATTHDADAYVEKQMLIYYNDDIREHGPLAEFAYLDSSSNFFWVPPGYASSLSYDSVAKAIQANAARIKRINNTWDTLTVNLLSGSIAAYTGKMHGVVTCIPGGVSTTLLIESATLIKWMGGSCCAGKRR